MLVNIIVLLILGFGLLKGWRRGFVLQAVHMLGFFLSIIIARFFYTDVAPILEKIIPYPEGGDGALQEALKILPLEGAYYNMIAFILLMFIARIAIQIVARALNIVTYLPVVNTLNRFLGAVLAFVERYVIVFFIILIMAFIPGTEAYIDESSVATTILEKTPFLKDIVAALGGIYK